MKLYDSAADVVRKSIVGHGLSPALVAEKTGLSVRDFSDLRGGRISRENALKLAALLELDAEALCQLSNYHPSLQETDGIIGIELPFEDEEVNIWIIESGETVLVIDCGFRPSDLSSCLVPYHGRPIHLLITHAHRDHIGGLADATPLLTSRHGPSGIPDCDPLNPGDQLNLGPFKINSVDLSGHHPRALGYFIESPEIRAFAVGDAIFAGSMGGCPDVHSFKQARRTIEASLKNEEADLLLLPGHGPATTLDHELKSNPFLAAWMD